jgi:hypothetical protein
MAGRWNLGGESMTDTSSENVRTTTTIGKEWYYLKIRAAEVEAFETMVSAELHADAGNVEVAIQLLGKTIRGLIAAQRRLAVEVFGP